MRDYKIWVNTEYGKAIVIEMESDSDEKAVKFAQAVSKSKKAIGYVLEKKLFWFIFRTIKIEVLKK